MAKGKKKSYRRYFKKSRRRGRRTIPILPLIGIGVGVTSKEYGGTSVVDDILEQNLGPYGLFHALVGNFTGYDTVTGRFDIMRAKGLQAVVVGTVAHKALGWMGINRMFSRAPSPLNKFSL